MDQTIGPAPAARPARDDTSHDSPSNDSPSNDSPSNDRDTAGPDRLGTLSVALGVAGLLPVLPLLGSIAAIACGWVARSRTGLPSSERDRALVGVVLGALGLAAPLVALFVYCVVLGYPFPIHRYRG
ncbi:hypothetical protein [Dermatobacter hominis]|uniref:hypothetical protein n=1 Tax=Dermatobacter hominis TaxID=2884263 RepID=UPI001D101D8E|nr:hypothetical protein [Dermatobacter hominis]UDY34264.1 hypothetical protein LH044_13045 [Dermatobacter hominis]